MKIKNIYPDFLKIFLAQGVQIFSSKNLDTDIHLLLELAKEWSLDLDNVHRWMLSPEYKSSQKSAQVFTDASVDLVDQIQNIFKTKLKGELLLSPSLMRFDGFARYDSGLHKVIFGVDHPDADFTYLKVLLAHELSHVYRDHSPRVWEFLGKPLEQITRSEYLDNFSANEHLVSEGLATLFSQAAYPDVPLRIHHFYSDEEMQWCMLHFSEIEAAIIETLKGDEDVWKFYYPGAAGADSPSRVQYFWAAKKLSDWLKGKPGKSFLEQVVWALGQPSEVFDCFKV